MTKIYKINLIGPLVNLEFYARDIQGAFNYCENNIVDNVDNFRKVITDAWDRGIRTH